MLTGDPSSMTCPYDNGNQIVDRVRNSQSGFPRHPAGNSLRFRTNSLPLGAQFPQASSLDCGAETAKAGRRRGQEASEASRVFSPV